MVAEACPCAASVIVCAFDDGRWADLRRAIDSLSRQSRAVDELIVVIDHNRELLRRAQAELERARVVANHHAQGLSGARNTGVETAIGDVLVFIDDDAVAEPNWLATLVSRYRDPQVIAVGGAVVPRWDRGRPRGFPEEFDWVVGCSYRGLPVTERPVRNLIGANMSFRREVLERVGGFSDGIGRVGRKPVGCEETELCIRVGAEFPGAVILYDPAARVSHRVPQTRASWRYFCSRCFSEGLSKALVARIAGVNRGLSSERSYTTRTLPFAIARGLGSTLSGDPAGIIRVAALVAGLWITGLGFLAGSAKPALTASARRRRPSAKPGDDWLLLDVHGRVGIRVRRDAPGARQLADMFSPFQTDRLEHCDLTVHGQFEPLDEMVAADGDHRYRPDAVELPTRLQVIADGDGFRLAGPGELLAPVVALLDALIAARGAAMVHAATVARDGRGVCLAAAGGAGKTSAAVGLVRGHGFAFMGDDWTFITGDGCILGYAKPLFVRPYHRLLFPQLFVDKHKPLVPARLVRPLGRIATAAHPTISRRPALARIARGWWPEHMIVAPEIALPGTAIARTATLAATVFLERAAHGPMGLEPRDPAWMASRLVGNFVAELPRGARDLQALLGATGLLAFDALISDKARILRRALEGRPCFLLRVPDRMPAQDAAVAIAQRVDQLLEAGRAAEVAGA
jgi:glucosyl-dolichyl phosphate glucuronosyltransferase